MKFLGFLAVVAIALAAAFLFLQLPELGDTPSYDLSDVDDSGAELPEPADTAYYHQLTPFEQSIYNALLPTVSTAGKTVEFTNVNIMDFSDCCYTVTRALQYDHPEYFWFTGGYSFDYSFHAFSDEGDITLTPKYYEYAAAFFDVAEKGEKLDKAVKNVADKARRHTADPYGQMVFVHDYLVKNAYYDHDGLEDYYQTSHNPASEYIFSAYGCLVNGKTVCSGYAKAYMLVLRELGLDCLYVVGDAGEAHGWNCVYLDGEGYYVDITWDDPDFEPEIPLYNYAFITEETLSRTHTVDMPFTPPACTATKYDYYLHRGYYDGEYDFATAQTIITKQAGGKAAYLRFGSLAELQQAIKDLFDNKKIHKIAGGKRYGRYTYNEDLYTLTLLP